jgi:predicted phosphodiesterase
MLYESWGELLPHGWGGDCGDTAMRGLRNPVLWFLMLVASVASADPHVQGLIAGFDVESPGASFPEVGLGWPDRPPVRKPAEELVLVFATIADSHIKTYMFDDHRYLKALSISRELLSNYVSDINAHRPPVDFVVHLGDITDGGIVSEFNRARLILDGLTCPVFPVLGNHDNFASDYKQAWKDFAGRDSTTYAFDHLAYHFIVIDCTPNPYDPAEIECGPALREWVAADLAANSGKHTIILSHYNMWERGWNAMFDTTGHFAEYEGMAELRQVFEQAGNVVAVINGHVHANRVEVHNGIHYIDVGATLVGRPSIRYFYMYAGRITVTYEYISNQELFNHVAGLCPLCCCCFDRFAVCDFIDGEDADKRFTIPFGIPPPPPSSIACPAVLLDFELMDDAGGGIIATVRSGTRGLLEYSLYDVRGRLVDRCLVHKGQAVSVTDLGSTMESIRHLSGGVYFVRARIGPAARTEKLVLAH